MTDLTFYGELIKIDNDKGYLKYVFKLNDGTLKQCTKLKNWGDKYNLKQGDVGYITVREIKAGDTYFDIDIQAEIDSDYDVDRLAERVKK